MKIAFIGAGSQVFCVKIITDILSFPELRKNIEICLMDIDPVRLQHTLKILETYKADHQDKLNEVKFSSTTDQREAIRDAKYVISAFLVGGSEAYKNDILIPMKYKVYQNVADTCSAGAIFRFLRNVPVFQEIAKNMKEVGYNAGESNRSPPLHLNYVNPMAMNTWYCNLVFPDSTVGLCHGVQHTAELGLQWWLGVSPHQMYYMAAGINHMAWFIDLKYKDPDNPNAPWRDGYPLLNEHIKEEPGLIGTEKVRFDMMKATGYFMTESSGHLAEYLPYYMKREDLRKKYGGGDKGVNSLSPEQAIGRFQEMEKAYEELESKEIKHMGFKDQKSEEYGAAIIHAMETNIPFVFNGNVINKKGSRITNLLADCCVEVPCTANFSGIHPQGGIELPPVCAGLCSSNIMVQNCAVKGAFHKNRELIYHAMLLDPNNASVLCPEEIRQMTEEMFEANKKWLTWLF